MSRTVQASIETRGGTKIVLTGAQEEVAKVVSLFVGESATNPKSSGSGSKMGKGDLEGVAERDEQGNMHIVAQDLKATSAIDAARRLLYVGLLARRELLGEKKSPRADVMGLLKSYRLYDGNARKMVASEKGLIPEGRKFLSISSAAMPTAWEWVREMQDQNTKGRWTPTGSRKRRGRAAKK